MNVRRALLVATLLGATGVALGAIGAHALKAHLGVEPTAAQQIEWWQTAVHYQLVHALALMGLAATAHHARATGATWSARVMTLGVVLFCGSLYLLGATGNRSFAHLAPFGGISLILSWVIAAWAYFVGPDPSAVADA